MRFASSLIVLASLLAIAPAAAGAQGTNAPPGNSGIEEYLEVVPDATGKRVPGKEGKGAKPFSKGQERRLESAGRDGEALTDALERTAPAPSALNPMDAGGAAGGGGGGGGASAPGATGGDSSGRAGDPAAAAGERSGSSAPAASRSTSPESPALAVAGAVTGQSGPGSGLWLPVILLLLLGLALGSVLQSRRSRGGTAS